MFKPKKVLHPRTIKVFRKNLPASASPKVVTNGAVKKDKKFGWTFILFLTGIFIFGASLCLFYFQDLLPHVHQTTIQIVKPNAVVQGSQQLANSLHKNNIPYESITSATESPSFIVKLPSNTYAYFSATEDISSQARLLSDILSRVSIENPNKKLKFVDLRFEKAIIKFQ